MTFEIKKAERTQMKSRVWFFWNSWTWKTKSSLLFAKWLVEEWAKIVVIDTENGRSEAYADMWDFSVLKLTPPFSPDRYIKAIEECEKAWFECIIIDSISHEWMWEWWILDTWDKMWSNNVNKWSTLTPLHNKFVHKIQNSQVHVLCCGRTKESISVDKVQEEWREKTVVTRVPTKIETREWFEYEMLISFFLDKDHSVTVEKDNTWLFDGDHFIIDESKWAELRDWIMTGKRVLNPIEQKSANFKMYSENIESIEKGEDFVNFINEMKEEIWDTEARHEFFGEENYNKLLKVIDKKKQELKDKKIESLKQEIKNEEDSIKVNEESPTDTEQFRKALAKQKEQLQKKKDDLQKLENPDGKENKNNPKK